MQPFLARLKRRVHARSRLGAQVSQLNDRVDRLERAVRRHREETAAQLKRADAMAEDLASAIDLLRRRADQRGDDQPR